MAAELKRRAVVSAILLLAGTPVGMAADDVINPEVVVGNTAKGELAFVRQCALCHTINKDGPNGFGPNLFGIVDRKAATAKGYTYSPAFESLANWTWSPDGVASFIIAPAATIPGNRMSPFQGVSDEDVNDIIAYLATQR